MQSERCTNQNHNKMNVPVRYCSQCGEVVNADIPKTQCSPDQHARSRKSRNKYCSSCGTNLIK